MHVSEFFSRLRAVARELAEEHALSLGRWVDLDSARVESRGPGRGCVVFTQWHQDLSGESGQLLVDWFRVGDRVRVCPNGGGRVVEFSLADIHAAGAADWLRRGRESQALAVCAAIDRNWARAEARRAE